MAKSDWHFPRREFTHDVFVTLTRGPSPALSLFGPRRTGKTEFLLYDLGAHAADTYKHRVVYLSFWQTSAAPLALLLYACDQALRPKSYAERLADWAANPPIKIKLQALKGMAGVEIDLGQSQSADPDNELLLLDLYLSRLANKKKPAILMLDEFQELANHAQGQQVMAALRTSLDRQRDGLKTVLTGSSQVTLNKVFSSREAPLFRFAAPLHLPPLGDDFVNHQLRVFKTVYRRKLNHADALLFFKRFQQNPMFFQRWITTLGLYPTLTGKEAAERTAQELAADLEFDETWRRLSTSHRAMARLIAERISDPFGAGGAARYADLAGEPAPIPQTRQSYNRTLMRRGITDQWNGDWRIADPIFEQWILDRRPEDF